MNWSIVWGEIAAFGAAFTAMVILPAIKHPELGVHNYPPEIQEAYFKTHPRVDTAPLSRRTVLIKGIALLVFGLVLAACARAAGARGFWQGASFGALTFAVIGAWDTFFLDWVLFARWKIFRLPGTEHMDAAYAQKWFHVKGMLFPGSLFLVLAAALTGALTALLGG